MDPLLYALGCEALHFLTSGAIGWLAYSSLALSCGLRLRPLDAIEVFLLCGSVGALYDLDHILAGGRAWHHAQALLAAGGLVLGGVGALYVRLMGRFLD